MPPPAPTLENSIRFMRTFFFTILVAAAMQISLAEKLSHQEPRDVHVIWVGFLVNGLLIAGIALFFRMRMVTAAIEALRTKPEDQSAIGRWRAGNILSCVLAESIVLFGFALRFIGGTSVQSLPFYLAGMAMMILWFPRRP